MTLYRTSIQGLRARTAQLQTDFEFWRQRAAGTGDLRQHNTQVGRIIDTLTGTLQEALGGTPILTMEPVPDQGDLGVLPNHRRAVGSVHLLWEFFRDKFAQRDMTAYADHLGAADDLAWACFKPCLDAAVAAKMLAADDVKEPPLVFYSIDRSPYAQARTKAFHPEGLDSSDIEKFARVLMHLPVPVIGVPWSVANRVPDLTLVGHEVGHVVAEDLGLGNEFKLAIEGMVLPNDRSGQRRQVWSKWSDEVFADLFAVLATGTSFPSALAREMAAGVKDIQNTPIDPGDPGRYPTPSLRMALCEWVLKRLGISPSPAWTCAYQAPVGDSGAYKDDVALIADTMISRQWTALGGKTLTEVIPWQLQDEKHAETVANDWLSATPPNVPFSVRVYVAAAVAAFETDPVAYASRAIDMKLARFIVSRRSDAVRSAHASSLRAGLEGATPGELESPAIRQAADQNAGRRIADLLGLHPAP